MEITNVFARFTPSPSSLCLPRYSHRPNLLPSFTKAADNLSCPTSITGNDELWDFAVSTRCLGKWEGIWWSGYWLSPSRWGLGEEYGAVGNGHTTGSKDKFFVPLVLVPCFSFISQRFQPEFREVKVIFTQCFTDVFTGTIDTSPTLSLQQGNWTIHDNTIRIQSIAVADLQIFMWGVVDWIHRTGSFSHETNDLGPRDFHQRCSSTSKNLTFLVSPSKQGKT